MALRATTPALVSTLTAVAGLLVAVVCTLMDVKASYGDADPPVSAPKPPDAVIEQTSHDLLVLIEESREYAEADPERFFVEVEALLRYVVDFKGFARSVMAAHHKTASTEQRERFAETFKWGLVRSYALALVGFSDGEIVMVPSDRPPRSPRRKNVKMEIRLRGGEVYPVVYSMALGKDNAWRMRNIIINGVNVGLTYRSQFASAVQDPKYGGDLDAVIDAWAKLLTGDVDQEAGAESAAAGQS